MNLQAAQELLERPGEVSAIQLALVNPREEARLMQEISSALPHLRVISLQQALLGREELLSRLSRLSLTLSAVVFFAGLLAVSLGIAAAVKERTREIGIFRAIGFRKRHVFKMILLEGVFISLGGGMLGYLAGALLTRLLAPCSWAAGRRCPGAQIFSCRLCCWPSSWACWPASTQPGRRQSLTRLRPFAFINTPYV